MASNVSEGGKRRTTSKKHFPKRGDLPVAKTYEFGPFRLDTDAEILFRGAQPIILGQRAVALLRLVLEQAETPVSKDALFEAPWPGLAVCLRSIRRALRLLRRQRHCSP